MQLDPNNVQVSRQMASHPSDRARNWQQMGEDADARPRRRRRQRTTARRSCTTSASCSRTPHGPAREGHRLLQARSRGRSAVPADARGARAHLRRAATTPSWCGSSTAKVQALTDPEAIAAHKLRMGGLYETSLGNLERGGAGLPRGARGRRQPTCPRCGASSGLQERSRAGRNWSEVLEQQLDVVETERERVEVLLKLARPPGGAVPQAGTGRAQRWSRRWRSMPARCAPTIALERCYQRLKQWLDLVNTYERHIGESPTIRNEDPALLRDCPGLRGRGGRRRSRDRRLSQHRRPRRNEHPALDAAGQAVREAGRCAAVHRRDGARGGADARTAPRRWRCIYRIGKTLDEKLSDRSQAQERFEMALDLDPAHLPTLAALRTIAIDEAGLGSRGPLPGPGAAQHPGAARPRQSCWSSSANCATRCWASTSRRSRPTSSPCSATTTARTPRYRWCRSTVGPSGGRQAEPLAELLVKQGQGPRATRAAHAATSCRARCSLPSEVRQGAQGVPDRAPARPDRPGDDPRHRRRRLRAEGLADVADQLPEGADGSRRRATPSSGRTSTSGSAASSASRGRSGRPSTTSRRLWALNHEHRPTLDALVEIYAKLNDWKQVAAYKRQILDGVFESEERYALLNEIGDVWAEKDNNVPKAIEAYEEALELKPQDHILLHKLLQLYSKTGDWQKMVDTAAGHRGPRGAARDQGAVLLHDGAALPRQARGSGSRRGAVQRGAGPESRATCEAFERINKILTAAEELEAARACPTAR